MIVICTVYSNFNSILLVVTHYYKAVKTNKYKMGCPDVRLSIATRDIARESPELVLSPGKQSKSANK